MYQIGEWVEVEGVESIAEWKAMAQDAYRELRRAVANQAEDIRATGTTTSDIPGVEESIRQLRRAVEEEAMNG